MSDGNRRLIDQEGLRSCLKAGGSTGDGADLAADLAFARWDLAHLHGFELADGRRIGIFDPECPGDWLDETTLKAAQEVGSGEAFDYVFDFGDDWHHRCTVEPEKADPLEEYGTKPSAPVSIWGLGNDSRPVFLSLAMREERTPIRSLQAVGPELLGA